MRGRAPTGVPATKSGTVRRLRSSAIVEKRLTGTDVQGWPLLLLWTGRRCCCPRLRRTDCDRESHALKAAAHVRVPGQAKHRRRGNCAPTDSACTVQSNVDALRLSLLGLQRRRLRRSNPKSVD